MKMKELPVYLFTGFLDAGKTTFIQETLEDPNFNDGLTTLLLVTEEGEADYEPSKFADSGVKIEVIDKIEDLDYKYLKWLEAKTRCQKVVIEYNGMWDLNVLYENMPENWLIYQEMLFIDSETFINYNNNMRQLVYDKLKSAETVIFKKFTESMDKMMFHKIVRGANRKSDILYEYSSDNVELDNIEDPLPFDLAAEIVEIEDKDYAIWYADMNEEEDKYYGKILKYKGRCLIGGGLEKDEFVIGRHIMSCCIDDIQFGGLMAKWREANKLEKGQWVEMTALLKKEYNKMYKSEGPVFYVKELQTIEPIKDEVATFY